MATIDPNFESICINPNDDLVLYKKEIIRSRIEKFLYAICSLDNDDLPTPLSRIEEMYKCLVMGVDFITFTPLSRAEKFVMAMLGAYDVELLPTPISRSEALMKKIATGDNNLDDIDNLQSRYEFLLAYIIKAGGFNGGSGDFYYNLTSLTSGFTTIYDTLDKPVKNAVLKGQTLVNYYKLTGSIPYTYKKGSSPSGKLTANLSANKAYLILLDFSTVDTDGKGILQFFPMSTFIDATKKQESNFSINKAGRFTYKYTPTKDVKDYVVTIGQNNFENYNPTVVLEGVMIIEYQDGMENWDIPYFEGMASVKMPVLTTTGKNLFDGELKVGGLASNGAVDYNFSNRIVSYNFIPIKNNMQYKLSSADNLLLSRVCFYDNNKQIISESYTTDFISPTNAKYLKFAFMDTENIESRIMLEEGSTTSTYEPHKSNILTCNEEVELRGIGDIKDELNLVTGEYTKAIYEYTFTGNEHWEIGGGATGGYTYFQCRLNQLPINYKYTTDANIPISCNNLPTVTYNDFDNRLKSVGINLTYFFRLNFSDCDSNNGATVEDLKAYLKANPTTVQYPISKSVKTVDLTTLDQDGKETELTTFDDITHVTVSSEGLVPTGEIYIARPIQFVDYSLDNGDTTLYNTIDRPVKNAVLRGQTLKNITDYNIKANSNVTIDADGTITITATGTYTEVFLPALEKLPSTKYWVGINVIENTLNGDFVFHATTGVNCIFAYSANITQGFVGVNEQVRTTMADVSSAVYAFRSYLASKVTEGSIKYKVMAIPYQEGMENLDIPYFTGIQSVKIPVLTTTGKNLFYGTLESGDFNTSTGIPNNNSKSIVRTKEYNEISPNKTYRITVFNPQSTLSTFSVYQYDNDFNFIKRTDSNVLTTNANTKYVKFRFRQSDNSEFTEEELAALSCMITEGDTIPNTYEPYKSTTVTIDSDVLLTTEKDHFIVTENGSQIVLYNNEEVELRGIGEVKDELNLTTGELTQRIGEIVLDGDENWNSYGSQSNQVNTVAFKLSHTNHVSSWGTGFGCCDKLPFTNGNVVYGQDLEGVTTDANSIIVRVNKSKASSIDEFKAWLSNYNIRVVYPNKENVIKTVDLSTLDQDGKETELSTFDDITHVTVSSEGLVPTGEITVATKNATDVIDASVMSLRMDDILNSQGTLEGSANAQSDDIDVAMLGMTDIYEQLL